MSPVGAPSTNSLASRPESPRLPATAHGAGVELAGIRSVVPARILDTRVGLGAPQGPVGEAAAIDVPVLAQHGVPASGVDTVVLNVTVVRPTATSYVTIWPSGVPRPETSSLNMTPGLTIANLVVTKVGAGGMVSLFNRFGTTHLVADVVGYSTASEHLQPIVPSRILDTRSGVGTPAGKVGPSASIDVVVVGRGGVPVTGVGSVLLNLTVTQPTADSYVTVWPTGLERPEASSLNMSSGETRPNMVVAKVGADGKVSLFNRFGTTHLIADVVGWMPEYGAYTAINPIRVLDTRNGTGHYGTALYNEMFGGYILRPGVFDGPVREGRTIAVSVEQSVVPPAATALVLNLTAVGATKATYITSWPFGQPMPTASVLNVVPGDVAPNMVVVERGGAGQWLLGGTYFNLFNAFGDVHLVADVVGYFVPWDAQDAVDPVANSIHIVVAAPSDVPFTITDEAALHTVRVAEGWLRDQSGRGLRLDTADGDVEVSRLRFSRTREDLQDEIAFSGYFGFEGVFDEVIAGGFANPRKKYVVFVESLWSGNVAGIADSPGPIGLVFTSEVDVDTSLTWTSSDVPAVVLHELFHTVGAVSTCAPNATPGGGHVAEELDLMYDGLLADPELLVLDVGRDDYWGQGDSLCDGEPYPDLSLTPYFE